MSHPFRPLVENPTSQWKWPCGFHTGADVVADEMLLPPTASPAVLPAPTSWSSEAVGSNPLESEGPRDERAIARLPKALCALRREGANADVPMRPAGR